MATTVPNGAPDMAEAIEYMTSVLGRAPDTDTAVAIQYALVAEANDQANRLRFPLLDGTPIYTPALCEALCRRVAHNIAVRALPLGLQATVTDGSATTNQVGGTDAEVRRLEAPYRKLVLG